MSRTPVSSSDAAHSAAAEELTGVRDMVAFPA